MFCIVDEALYILLRHERFIYLFECTFMISSSILCICLYAVNYCDSFLKQHVYLIPNNYSFISAMIFIFGLIACLIPYDYFSFQVGSLCFKSFKLVLYVLKVSSWSKTLLTLE